MPENREQNQAGRDAQEAAAEGAQLEASTEGAGGDAMDLDLEGLDLTVETVEERISPSETNVFDK